MPDRLRSHVSAVKSRLASAMPTRRPVRVAIRQAACGNFGSCSLGKRWITITIHARITDRKSGKRRAVTIPELHDTLLHEWAHAVVFDSGGEVEEHGKRWGAAYARAYRIVNEDGK